MNIERGPYTNAIVFTGGSYNIFSYYTKIAMDKYITPRQLFGFLLMYTSIQALLEKL